MVQDGMFGAPMRFSNSSIRMLSISPTLAESSYVLLTKLKPVNCNTTRTSLQFNWMLMLADVDWRAVSKTRGVFTTADDAVTAGDGDV